MLYAVTHSVLQAITAEEKSSCLCTRVYGTQALPRPRKRMQLRLRQHDRALKKVTQLKNDARRALRRAKKLGESAPIIQSLAANFLYLLRTHSRLKRDSSHRLQHMEAKIARNECNQDFWRYAKGLLDGESTSQTVPDFSASSAFSFFSEVYESAPHQFEHPSWMPVPLHPSQAVLWR